MKVDRLIGIDFLVDRWRNGEASAASIYARLHPEDSLAIPWIVKGEFLSFTAIDGKASPQLLELLARYPTHWPDEELLVSYARLNALLRRQSLSLRNEDLWIAISALRHTREFGKVPGIKLDPF